MSSNFDFLSKYWPDLSEIGKTAEMYLYSDSNACIYIDSASAGSTST